MRRLIRFLALVPLLLGVLGTGQWGCRREPPETGPTAPSARHALRIHVLGTVAGALEPCGCVKDMLGGVQHAAAITGSGRTAAEGELLLAAGPLLFTDPELGGAARAQNLAKAETLAETMADMGLAAWVPGANDWAAGAAELARLSRKSGAHLLAANLRGAAGARATAVVRAGRLDVGLTAVSSPLVSGAPPKGVDVLEPSRALEAARLELEQRGARLKIALLAVERGEALRLAERVSGYQLMVVGKPLDRGDSNDAPTPPEMVGDTLVVQAPNHLQGVVVVDLYLRGDDFHVRDGSGARAAERKSSLGERISELAKRIALGEKNGARSEDLEARRRELAALKKELAELHADEAPREGSYFAYSLVEVRERAGADPKVAQRLREYYKRVNDHNRFAFADRMPLPVPPGERGYTGVVRCARCHTEEAQFWRTTEHAGAYDSLVRENKQYNLECVACHVTGYEKPGGTTVVHVNGLVHNQCENCHGPGSLHEKQPLAKDLIVPKPDRSLCARECHHPPHVNPGWSVDEAWKKIIGPGHGMESGQRSP